MITSKTRTKLSPFGHEILRALEDQGLTVNGFCRPRGLAPSNLMRSLKSARPNRLTAQYLRKELGLF